MKYFNIPGVYEHLTLNSWFLRLMKKNPEFFYKDIKINSVYGNFQYSIWEGGRNFPYYEQRTEEDILFIKKIYDRLGLPIRLIFTNSLLEKKHLNDRFCNIQLEIFHNERNEVVVNSKLLEDYIKNNFPKYKIISSTTKRILNKEQLLNELNNYYQVCLDYDLNKNIELLNSIPENLRFKCEFLINEACPSGCPNRQKHYTDISKTYLTYMKYKYDKKCKRVENYFNRFTKIDNFTLDDIDNYSKMGYQYFKINGRSFTSFNVLLEYTYYFVKPEWYIHVLMQAKAEKGIVSDSFNDIREEDLDKLYQ